MNKQLLDNVTVQPVSRRRFLRDTMLATGAMSALPFLGTGCRTARAGKVLGANDTINVASIGVGGKGSSDVDNAAKAGANIVALCDVDSITLEGKAKKFPQAKLYRDFRKMLDEMGKSIDAVTVSTPDHCHAVASVMAMKMGKHIYCQKPLTQTVYEARVMRQLAKEKKLATQMGNQGSASDGLRRAVEIIQAGLLGPVHEVHVWSNRPIWPQGLARPKGEDPVPATLDWDQWLGPAPYRPFKGASSEPAQNQKGKKGETTGRKRGVYHPFAWRGWVDFGTGALGDMACHTVNMPFRAVKMGYPNVVECEETSQLFPETYPKTSRIRFEFPAREGMPPLKFWWYDGNPKDSEVKPLRPHADITKEIIAMRDELPGSGCLIIGDKGKLFSPDDYAGQSYLVLKGEQEFKSIKEHEGAKAVPQSIPRLGSGDNDLAMKQEWFAMMKGGPPAYSNFDIAAYLTEIILLGCIALRVGPGKRMDWDGPNMKSTNRPEAAQFVKRQNRKGWSL